MSKEDTINTLRQAEKEVMINFHVSIQDMEAGYEKTLARNELLQSIQVHHDLCIARQGLRSAKARALISMLVDKSCNDVDGQVRRLVANLPTQREDDIWRLWDKTSRDTHAELLSSVDNHVEKSLLVELGASIPSLEDFMYRVKGTSDRLVETCRFNALHKQHEELKKTTFESHLKFVQGLDLQKANLEELAGLVMKFFQRMDIKSGPGSGGQYRPI